jgi:hypothetical protein
MVQWYNGTTVQRKKEGVRGGGRDKRHKTQEERGTKVQWYNGTKQGVEVKKNLVL